MAHFAQLNDENIVVQVVVVDNKTLMNPTTGKEEEIRGIFFCENTFGGRWVQTSYNHKIRNCYAGIGYFYDENLDIFIPPKPFPSWVLNNETGQWESPIGPPPDISKEDFEKGLFYEWDELNTQWKLIDRSI